MSSSNSFKLHSAFRTSYSTSSSDFFLKLPLTISGNWSLQSAIIPNSSYNVNITNNVIYWYDTESRNAQIVTGFYTSSTISSAVQTCLNSVGPGDYTVTYSAISGKLTITKGASTFYQEFTFTDNTSAKLLGFTNLDGSAATSQVSAHPINLAPVLSFNITINNETNIIQGSNSSCSFVVNNTIDSGDIVFYEPKTTYQEINLDPTSLLHIQIHDHFYNLIDLNNHDCEFVLKQT